MLFQEEVISRQAGPADAAAKQKSSTPSGEYLPLILLYTAILLLSLVLAWYQVGIERSQAKVMISEKIFLLVYLVIECCSLIIDNFPRASFVCFSILMNLLTVVVVGSYPISTVVLSLSILFIFIMCLDIIASKSVLIKDKLPIDITSFSSYFIVFSLGFCTLSGVNSWIFWNQSLPRLLGLVVGSILFSCFIVSNIQIMRGRGGKERQVPQLTVLRIAISFIYLLLTELAALTV